jgi:hypothetical protein
VHARKAPPPHHFSNGPPLIDSWAMNHFGKLRDINVSISINPWKLSGLTHCIGIALFTFGNEMVSSANRDDREV